MAVAQHLKRLDGEPDMVLRGEARRRLACGSTKIARIISAALSATAVTHCFACSSYSLGILYAVFAGEDSRAGR